MPDETSQTIVPIGNTEPVQSSSRDDSPPSMSVAGLFPKIQNAFESKDAKKIFVALILLITVVGLVIRDGIALAQHQNSYANVKIEISTNSSH
jgi:hypothetical protein